MAHEGHDLAVGKTRLRGTRGEDLAQSMSRAAGQTRLLAAVAEPIAEAVDRREGLAAIGHQEGRHAMAGLLDHRTQASRERNVHGDRVPVAVLVLSPLDPIAVDVPPTEHARVGNAHAELKEDDERQARRRADRVARLEAAHILFRPDDEAVAILRREIPHLDGRVDLGQVDADRVGEQLAKCLDHAVGRARRIGHAVDDQADVLRLQAG